MNGELNLTLAYVTHEQVNPMLADEDSLTNYATAREEMIACAPHRTDDELQRFKLIVEMLLMHLLWLLERQQHDLY
jgi:hypothetical protein